jgi:hypothetical protein
VQGGSFLLSYFTIKSTLKYKVNNEKNEFQGKSVKKS